MNTHTISNTVRSSDSGTLAQANQKTAGRQTGLARINFARRRVNRALDTFRLLNLLRSRAPEFFGVAEVVGQWVWIQFEQRPAVQARQQLAELGFHWNHTRQAWQHPCGLYRHEATPFDPRRYFGSYFPAGPRLAQDAVHCQ